jgi:hypothetical protein
MSGLQAAAPATATQTTRRTGRLQLDSLAISVMLLIEYGLGMAVNLYVSVRGADQSRGIWAALGRALSSSPILLAIHAAFGLLLAVAGVTVLAHAILARYVPAIASSAAGLLAILGAGFSGASFVSRGHDQASMAMAILMGIALLCYLLNIALLSSARTQRARRPGRGRSHYGNRRASAPSSSGASPHRGARPCRRGGRRGRG